jgi:hypothetical protein
MGKEAEIVRQAVDYGIQHPDRGWPWMFLILISFIGLATIFGGSVIGLTLFKVAKRHYKTKHSKAKALAAG